MFEHDLNVLSQSRFVYQIQLAHLAPNEKLWSWRWLVYKINSCGWNLIVLWKWRPQATILDWERVPGILASKFVLCKK